MNKGFAIAFTAVILAACSKVNVGEPTLPESFAKQELSFTVAKALSPTKADGDTFHGSEFTDPNGFGAYAWFTGDPVSEYWMKAVNITKQLSEGKYAWKPVTPYYWPKEHPLDFLCFAPYKNGACWFDVLDDAGNEASEGKANKITSHLKVTEFTEDLLFSDKAIKCTNSLTNETTDGINAFSGVPIIFRHALSKSGFRIVSDAYFNQDSTVYAHVTFRSATLRNVRNEGDLALYLKQTGSTTSTRGWQNKDTDGVWNTTDDKENINDEVDGTITVPTSPVTFIGNRMYIPQSLTDQILDLDITIEYYKTDDFERDPKTGEIIIDPDTCMPVVAEGKDFPAPTQKEDITRNQKLGDIPGAPIWRMGSYTDYLITVTPFTNEVTFDPTIANWDNTSAGFVISK
ncbi:MAG: fimbrillin family protein [Bacteroidia bacterium]|nr:fimbrillin family protein [Bacteroidia bacterium]